MTFLEVVGLLALIGVGLFLLYWSFLWAISYFVYDKSVKATKEHLDGAMKDWDLEQQKRWREYYGDS